MDLSQIKSIIEKYNSDESLILAMLQDVQREYNYLPMEAMEIIADELGVGLAKVASIATFYSSFSLKPRGKHIVTVCMGTACHVRGAPRVLSELERELEVSDGDTTSDGIFTIETVNCVGACALGPLVIVDGNYHGNITTSDVSGLIEEYKNK